jgi:hypothetical protein
MDGFDAGVAVTFGQDFRDSDALGRYFVATVPQFLDNDFKSFFGICHLRPHLYQVIIIL